MNAPYLLVHDHGVESGPGLACRETLIGECVRVALAQCLLEHVADFDCKHVPLDDCCSTCEGKRLLGISAGARVPSRRLEGL